jgi:NAD(P)-dependent dehydrogenase (short-subunit alcohol dehydrogenase family)
VSSGGRAAVVTGGGGAIGRATAVELGRRGFAVLVVDLDGELAEEAVRVVEAEGGRAAPVAADVSDRKAVERYVQACTERFGGIDAFFNNAAYAGPIAPLTEYPLDAFDRAMAVNVRGVFLGLQAVIPAMRERGGGTILNTSSQAGLRGVTNLCGYSASKHAVIGLSKGAALEVADDGIRVNALAPGPTDTRMMRDIDAEIARQGGDPDAFRARMPVGRYGTAEEIASLAAWVLADAPPFLTGATLSIDGGLTVP